VPHMRANFDTHEAGGWPARANRGPRGCLALIFILIIATFGWGTTIAAAYEALTDLEARGEMDPTW
jgi:hypothetical protein